MGIVIDEAQRRWKEIFACNESKNYLTALELASMLDNNVLDPTYDNAVDFLLNLGVYVKSEDEAQTVRSAVELARLAWTETVLKS